MKKVLLIVATLIVAVSFTNCNSCNSDKNQESTQQVLDDAQDALDEAATAIDEAAAEINEALLANIKNWNEGLFGTYVAPQLPAADAPGFNSTLKINGDLTYTLEQKVIDATDVFNENGKVTDLKVEDNIITLTAEDGTVKAFKLIENGNLLLINQDGTEPAQEFREAYTFVRQ